MRRASAAVLVFATALTASATVHQVEGPQDSLAGAPTINHCTLRKAVINSNTNTAAYPQCAAGSGIDVIDIPAFTITFALAGVNEDSGLTGDLDITESVIINGSTTAPTIIDGAAIDRLFDVHPGATLTLNNIHLRNGRGLGGGGAINANSGTIILNNVTISGSFADQGDGGAIYAGSTSTLTMTNSTVTGNSASFHAGAIVVEGTATITNSTIAGNASHTGLTGGIRGLATLRNSIVAGNTNISPLGYIPNLDGTFTSNGYNVIGLLGPAPGNPTIAATTGDQFNVTDAQLNLGTLQDNGGPVATRLPGSGSVAIDQGHASGSTTDQRALTRPCDLTPIANASGGDGSDVGAVEVQGTCAGTNTPPVATDDSATVAEDSGANSITVLTNDSDADGDALSVTAVTGAAHGTTAIGSGSMTVTYTPAPNFFGSDSFNYTITDGNGEFDSATVNVTVTNINDAPVATGAAFSINQDTILSVAAPGLLAGDTDVDGDALTAVLFSPAANGVATVNANGSFTYMPQPSFAGTDSFTYKAFDSALHSNAATVTITVIDTQGPTIVAAVATAVLWPPNHDLTNVGFTLSTTDNSPGTIATQVAVLSDEDAGSSDDVELTASSLLLRSERLGTGDGRVYLIRITATDAIGNSSRDCVPVVVPKSMSDRDLARVHQQAATARAACIATGSVTGFFLLE